MQCRIPGVLKKIGLAITAFLLLTVHDSGISKSSAAEKSLRSDATAALPASQATAKDVDPATRASIAKSYGNLPLSFEVNNGQVDSSVKYLSRGSGYTLFLTSTEAVLSLRQGFEKGQTARRSSEADTSKPAANEAIRLKLLGANPNPMTTGLDVLPGTSNYFIGNDPAKWRTGVANYEKIKIESVYPGIDLVYYGNQRQLEYDWIVNPGADPKVIRFAVEGKADLKDLKIDAQGNLILDETGELRLNKPFIYQRRAGARTEIAGRYILLGKREAGFQLDTYDASLQLVIDPVLSYSTYLGGSSNDYGNGIAVSSSGNAYVTGETLSADFPTAGPLQASSGGDYDAFVVKLNASGSGLVYSAYVGGGDNDYGNGIAVDSSGNAYVTGYTLSTDFPTASPLQASSGGGADAFVVKLNASGSAFVYSSYLGGNGSDHGNGIAVDSSANAYVTGDTFSTNFPTASPRQASSGGGEDAFVTKLNAAGSGLVYSTYLGGGGNDYGNAIVVDSSGSAYVTGETYSSNFPTANPHQASSGGNSDAFVTKLNALGSGLAYSTYLGGSSYDYGYGIAVHSSGTAYVAGYTYSSNFPTASPLQASYRGSSDAFVTKLNAAGNGLVYSTYLGSSSSDFGYGIAVDSSGSAYVTGYTDSTSFPMASPLQASYGGGGTDAFVTKLNALGSGLVYSTYLGGGNTDVGNGIAVDTAGNAYVTGYALSTNFPTANAVQAIYGGSSDAFVTRIGLPMYSGITIGDVDGDGKTDFSVWRPGNGVWYVLQSSLPGTFKATQWGMGTDIPVAGDYDGDGKMDLAVWRPGTGVWYILRSYESGAYISTKWGIADDIPVPGDYDGDGKMDVAVWRPGSGTFYVLPSKSPGTYTSIKWGAASDIPVLGRNQ